MTLATPTTGHARGVELASAVAQEPHVAGEQLLESRDVVGRQAGHEPRQHLLRGCARGLHP